MECGSYMKVVERNFEYRIQQQFDIDVSVGEGGSTKITLSQLLHVKYITSQNNFERG